MIKKNSSLEILPLPSTSIDETSYETSDRVAYAPTSVNLSSKSSTYMDFLRNSEIHPGSSQFYLMFRKCN